MSEVSEAAKLKAKELVGAEHKMLLGVDPGVSAMAALARYVHQASDAAKAVRTYVHSDFTDHPSLDLLAPFILPDPVDALVEVLRFEESEIHASYEKRAAFIRAELAKHGLQIVPVQS